jgi:hypothetical protein
MIADLDEAAEPVAWLVAADLIAVVAGVGGHDVEPHGQFSAAGQVSTHASSSGLPVRGANREFGSGLGEGAVREEAADAGQAPAGTGRVARPRVVVCLPFHETAPFDHQP